ncbi:unknown [Collinsella sp. CAG:166]|nr:unknown [Collinsella sp. CAG:166]
MVVGVMMVLVAMTVVLMVMLVAVLVFVLAMVMMVVIMLVCVLGSCFVAVEPGHIVIVVLELLCKLDVEIAGVDAMLVRSRDGNRKAVDRQRGKLFAQVPLAGAQV